MNSTWYVSFEVPKPLKRLGRQIPRATETFQSESEGKEFARVKYAAGRRSMLVRSTLTSLNEQSPGPMFIAG